MKRGGRLNYTYEITLEMSLRDPLPAVRIKQGDAQSRFVKAKLTQNDEIYIPESNVGILFRCVKPDGHAVIADNKVIDSEYERYLVINNGDGTITIELIAQVATTIGRCMCDLCLYDGDTILSTLPFIIQVLPSPNVADVATSSDAFNTLISRISAAENLMNGVAQSVGTLTLSTNWLGAESPYHQRVSVDGYNVTQYTKVDLVADPIVIESMLDSRTDEILIINESGVLTAYAIGGKPEQVLTVQVGLYETTSI